MTRTPLALLLPLALAACGNAVLEEGFEADLTEVCAANYVGGSDLDLYAADADATVSMWVSFEGILEGLEAGDPYEGTAAVGEDMTVSVSTGKNLREPCSDVSMNEVRIGRYDAGEGAASVTLEPFEDDGGSTWLATVVLSDVLLEPTGGGAEVDLTTFTFEAVEVWER